SKVSRDYVLELDSAAAPVLTVYGGKITTYRRLAEAALKRLAPLFPDLAPAWTRDAPLPGGDFGSLEALTQKWRDRLSWLPEPVLRRWLRQYGTRVTEVVGGAGSLADLGRDFGHGLYARELDYLHAREWALTAEDVLWRRSKLGLRFTAEQAAAVEAYLGSL